MTHFDPDALLTAMRLADRLEALPRTGWIVSRVVAPESIAAHSYGVAFAAMLLADAVAARPDPPPLDRLALLEIALVHDLAEALITDLPAPLKRRLGKATVAQAERDAAAELLAPLHPRYLQRFDAYNEGKSLEARLVKAADRIQMIVKALQYDAARRGDVRRFLELLEDMDDLGVPEVGAALDALRRHVQEGSWPREDL